MRRSACFSENGPNGEWRTVTYAQMRASARNVAQALLHRPLSAERPIAILSGNDIEHAALALGAMYAGIPFAPISPAYSLVSSDFGKLRLIFDILTPGLVFISDGAPFRKAIEKVLPPDAELVVSGDPAGLRCTPFSVLETTAATSDVDRAHAAVSARHYREVPLHFRIHRHAQRRHQYPAHAVQQSGNRADDVAVRRRRSADLMRLAAMESHFRRQSRFRAGALQRRILLHR